jgi:universal stress protein E
MLLQTILTILDKPKSAQSAFERSMALQESAGSHVNLTAFCWQASCDVEGTFSVDQSLSLQREILRARTQWQRDLISSTGNEARDLSLQTVWARDIAQWVTESLETEPADLVVKSVHQSRTIRHTPLDWELLRSCSAPLLLVSATQQSRTGPVLATLDLRHNDQVHRHLNRQVLIAASAFAKLNNVEVKCISVVEVSKILRDMDLVEVPALRRKFIAKVKPELEDLLAEFELDANEVIIRTGKVGKVVSQQAHRLNASLLVVGSLAHRAKQVLGLGNSAERIVSKARCDVLAVHP